MSPINTCDRIPLPRSICKIYAIFTCFTPTEHCSMSYGGGVGGGGCVCVCVCVCVCFRVKHVTHAITHTLYIDPVDCIGPVLKYSDVHFITHRV